MEATIINYLLFSPINNFAFTNYSTILNRLAHKAYIEITWKLTEYRLMSNKILAIYLMIKWLVLIIFACLTNVCGSCKYESLVLSRSHLIVITGTITSTIASLQYARENVSDDNSLERKKEKRKRRQVSIVFLFLCYLLFVLSQCYKFNINIWDRQTTMWWWCIENYNILIIIFLLDVCS